MNEIRPSTATYSNRCGHFIFDTRDDTLDCGVSLCARDRCLNISESCGIIGSKGVPATSCPRHHHNQDYTRLVVDNK